MKLEFEWLCKAWPTYRQYVKQCRWHKAREHKKANMSPMRWHLSLSEILLASGAISIYVYNSGDLCQTKVFTLPGMIHHGGMCVEG